MNRSWLLLLLLCPGMLQLNAQSLKPPGFDLYTKANGLSDNYVTGITQDSTGYLWVSTQWGLNRFDGNRFLQFHTGNDSTALPAENLQGMIWLDSKRIGITGVGLHTVDTRTGKKRNLFIPYHNKKYQFKFNMVVAARGDKEGNLFLLSRSGFYHFDKNCRLVSRFDYYSESEVPVHHFEFGGKLFQLDDMRFLVISINGLYVYHKGKKVLQKMNADEFPLLAEFMNYPRITYEFFQISPGKFFVFMQFGDKIVYLDISHKKKIVSALPFKLTGSEVGWRSKLFRVNDSLFYITGQQSGIYRIAFNSLTGAAKFYPQKEMDGFTCLDISKDRDGHFLIATNKGFLRERKQRTAVQTATLPASLTNQFPNTAFDDVCALGDKIYASTRGAGLAIFDKSTLHFERNILFDSIGSGLNYLRDLEIVNANTLLLALDGLPIFFHTNNSFAEKIKPPGWNAPYDWSNDLYRDNKNNIWISSRNVYRYEVKNNRFTTIQAPPQLLDVPFIITGDKNGNTWLGCHGIARYNTSLGRPDLYIDSFPFIKMPNMQVGALTIDDRNTVWCNNFDNGLAAYNIADKTFRLFTKKDGLPDNLITALFAVGDKIWIACYSGIACIDINDFRITSFGKEDGFPASTIVNGSHFFYDSVQQQLYIPFADTIVRFNPNKILEKKHPPQAFIESIVLNGEDLYYLPRGNFTTSWRAKELTVSIGSINFFDGATQRYAYRFAGNDSVPWIDLGNQSSFSISQLSPGNHKLQVKIYSAANRWPEQVKELDLIVLPPLWMKPWFLALAALALLWLIYFLVRWRSSVARRKEMVNTQMEKLRAEDYKAQFELEQISNYFSSSLAGKKTEDEVLWDVAANLIGRMNYEDCIIYRWNKTKTAMLQKAAYGPKGKPELILQDGFEVKPGQGIVGYVMETGKPLLVSDTRKDRRYRVDDEFRLSELAVPIIHNNELLGVIDSEHSQVNYFTDRDIKILTTIAALIGNKIKQLESEQSLEAKKRELAGINEQLAEARLSALQAQMNPHFVFNALNSIKRMILDGDNQVASRYLSKFALMIRMTLEHSKETFVTLQDNMQYLKAYLEMEKLRFDDTFTYTISTDDIIDTTETMLPSMMIQPLVENAIWHGLMYAGEDKKLSVFFSQHGNKITCTIEDNGIGIRQSEILRQQHRPMHRSVGLENLQKRIKIMNEKYNTECSLRIIDLKEAGLKPSGTRAVLEFNLINV